MDVETSELVTEVEESVPKATVPPFPAKVPAQAVVELSAPTLKVIEGSTEAVTPTWSMVTIVMANEPVMLAEPAKVTVYEPALPGLVEVNGVTPPTVKVPVQAVLPPVSVKTVVPKPGVADPPPLQTTSGVVVKVPKVAGYVIVSVLVLVMPAPGSTIETTCEALTFTCCRDRVSFMLVAAAARTGSEPN